MAWVPSRRWIVTGSAAGLVQIFSISPDYSQCNEEKVIQGVFPRVRHRVCGVQLTKSDPFDSALGSRDLFGGRCRTGYYHHRQS
jgi:hypothetical protein